ncbi:MAG: hypothetical protein RBG1_1C00001G0599 [candidate division Zixibacteria bacterium RBG-1]|nr:MAG: hypothetical protein RBG1_1C00001G0599 [candidate division Zixibacteria bacterium RBG-1]
MKKFLSIIIVLLLTGIGYAQDPGIPDTVNFGTCQSYIVADGDSLYGKVKIPLRIFNDEALSGIQAISLKWGGPLLFDTSVFYGQRADSANLKYFGFDNNKKAVLIQAISFGQMPPDTGLFLFMVFQAYDTGLVKIDTFRPGGCPECPIMFVSPQATDWVPLFESKEFQLIKSDTTPGDLNGNNLVNLVDVVILVDFLFKNQYQGFLLPAADVNSDCLIRLSDVVYLINHLFRDSEKPKPGCAF